MKFLKGLAVTIVGFLLFLSLSAWTTLFAVKPLVNPDFMVAEINNLDAAKLGKEMIGDQIKSQLPPGFNLSGAVDQVFDELAPWFREQMGDVTYVFYDYLGGKTEHLSVTISLEPVRTAVEAKVRQALTESPSPEIAGLPAAQQETLIDQYAAQFAAVVPDNLSFTENSIPAEFGGIVAYLKWAVTNFNALYWGLLALMVVLALCLFALYQDVKGFTRSLASPLVSVGVLGYAGLWIYSRLLLPQMGMLGLPEELGRWLNQFMADVFAPLYILYIGLAAGGVVLFLISIFWRRRAAEKAPG